MAITSMLHCTNCKAPLPAEQFNTGHIFLCPQCKKRHWVQVFPALWKKKATGPQAGQSIEAGESSCFYHADKKAAQACEECGRFICSLCMVEFQKRTLCPACIQSGKTKSKIKDLETEQVNYDDLAASLAVLPMLIWPITCITAPICLYIVLRYWKKPLSIVRKSRVRFVLSAIFATLQIAIWVILLLNFWRD